MLLTAAICARSDTSVVRSSRTTTAPPGTGCADILDQIRLVRLSATENTGPTAARPLRRQITAADSSGVVARSPSSRNIHGGSNTER